MMVMMVMPPRARESQMQMRGNAFYHIQARALSLSLILILSVLLCILLVLVCHFCCALCQPALCDWGSRKNDVQRTENQSTCYGSSPFRLVYVAASCVAFQFNAWLWVACAMRAYCPALDGKHTPLYAVICWGQERSVWYGERERERACICWYTADFMRRANGYTGFQLKWTRAVFFLCLLQRWAVCGLLQVFWVDFYFLGSGADIATRLFCVSIDKTNIISLFICRIKKIFWRLKSLVCSKL